MAVVDLKEEYSAKLSNLGEKHEAVRQRLLKENSSIQSKLSAL